MNAVPFWYKLIALAALVAAIFFSGFGLAKYYDGEKIGKLNAQVTALSKTVEDNQTILRKAVADKTALVRQVADQNNQITLLSSKAETIRSLAEKQMQVASAKYTELDRKYRAAVSSIAIAPIPDTIPDGIRDELTSCRRAVEINNKFEESLK